MTTLRRQIVESIATLLSAGVDWTVSTRGLPDERSATSGGKRAIVLLEDETKDYGETEARDVLLRVAVRVLVDPALVAAGANPFAVLDEAIAELEVLVPDGDTDPTTALGVTGVASIQLHGHQLDRPDQQTGELAATMRISVRHSHDLQDPSAFRGQP